MSNLSSLSSRLSNLSVRLLVDEAVPDAGQTPVTLSFSDGSRLKAFYWRLISGGQAKLSSFDHGQRYGLPEPIDAIDALRTILDNLVCVDAYLVLESGDLSFDFSDDIRFQVFNFSSYEVWEFTFPDGVTEYSNYAPEAS
jgi:hypothetical protein